MAQIQEEIIILSCPRCGSEYIWRKGHDRYGRQLYWCKDCNRQWANEAELRNPIENRKVHPKVEFKPRPLPSFDSLIGCPCVGCPEADHGCKPESCDKIVEWLLVEVLQ
ncbi:IS1 family transposase [Candidatus Bathyarchaeota archaeon]|nr:IS1 family transposase [Candidatus Bathyarchaeota archaeon]